MKDRMVKLRTISTAVLLFFLIGAASAQVSLRPMPLKGFPFGSEGVVDPVDMMLDDAGYLWLIDQRSSYCLLNDLLEPVHELTGTEEVLGWGGYSNNALLVRTTKDPIALPLGTGARHPELFRHRTAEDLRTVLLPDGRSVHLTDSASLVITRGSETLVQDLSDDRHGRMFDLVVGKVGRLLFDPGNGIWILGENGLVLAGHADPVFAITNVPGEPGKVTQMREVSASNSVAVLSHARGLYFQETGTEHPIEQVTKDDHGNGIGGVKWWTIQGREYVHGAFQVQEVDLIKRTARTVVDVRDVMPPGTATRINNFEADPNCRFMYIGLLDNHLVVHDPESGRSVARQLMTAGSYSGINLIYESGLFSGDRAIVITEHDLFLVDGMDGPIRPANTEWPSFRFGPRFQPSSVRVIGDTLVAIASFANGMYLYHVAKDSLYRPIGTDVDRMEIVDLFKDDGDHLFGTCRDGLLVYSLRDNSCRMIRAEHGLPMENLHYRYMSLIAPGTLTIGLIDRFTTFHVTDLLGDLSSVHLQTLEVNGIRQHLPAHRSAGSALMLGPQENNIAFTLGSPFHFAMPFTAYSVRLKDEPGSERFLGSHATARFFNLDAGDHTIQVALGPSGPFVDLMHVTVAQPLYLRWWFMATIVLLVLGVVLLIFLLRMRHVRHEATMKANYDARIAQLELSSLRAQMHPHFIFNSLNSIKSFIAGNEPRTATRYLNKFSLLIRSILNNSRHARVDLRSELKALELYLELEQMRFAKSFELSIDVDPAIDQDEVTIPPMVLQPFAENAIWHGLMHKDGARELKITIQRKGDALVAVVRDNGIGRAAAQAMQSKTATTHRSHGMSITAEIIERTRNGNAGGVEVIDLTDENGSAAGTEVIITIPLEKEA